MTAIIVGGIFTFMACVLLLVVGLLAIRAFLQRTKESGVNVFDGVSAEEWSEMRRIFRDVRRTELEVQVKEKLAKAIADQHPQTTSAKTKSA
jgi:hypothetical protein